MKRYRVNFPLLIALAVALVVALPSFYFLWRFQVDRNADRLRDLADKALEQDSEFEALDYMYRYIVLRPEDVEGLREATDLASDVAHSDDADDEQRQMAFEVLTFGVGKSTDPGVRRNYVDALAPMAAMGSTDYAKMALRHVNELIESGNADAELYAAKAQMEWTLRDYAELEKLARQAIGYDSKTDEFSTADAIAADQPEIYRLYATVLKYQRDQPELADRVIARMTEMNPESADAYLWSYRFKLSDSAKAELEADKLTRQAREAGKSEKDAQDAGAGQLELAEAKKQEALQDLARAYELSPEDAGVLEAKGNQAIADYQQAIKDGKTEEEAAPLLDAAAEFLELGARKYPRNIMFVLRAAQVETMRKNLDGALAIVTRGLETFELPSRGALEIANMRIDLQMQQNDMDAVEKSIAELRDFDSASLQALADFHQARLEMVRKDWSKAARMLRVAKVRLIGFPQLQAAASFYQGVAHQQLGQLDLAADAFEWAVSKAPDNQRAAEALANVQLVRKPSDAGGGDPTGLSAIIAHELQKPVEEQDWAAVNRKVEQYMEQRDLPITRLLEMKAEILIRRAYATDDEAKKAEIFQEARDLIRDAYQVDKENIRIRLLAIRLLQYEPGKGPAAALALLDKMIADPDVEDSPPMRLVRAELLAANHDDDVVNQLLAVTAGIDAWTAEQQAQVYAEVGKRLAQMGATKEAQESLEKATSLVANDLPTCKLLFDVALQRRDAAGIQLAQDRIKKILGSESAPDYVLAEVRRRLSLYELNELSKADLDEAEAMLDEALKMRSTWSDLWVAKGQLELALRSDVEAALRAFDKALETGRANPAALRVQIGLLYELGRMNEAMSKMELLSAEYRPALLGRTAAAIYAANGRVEEAYEAAKTTAEGKPNDAGTQLWFADMAVRAGKFDDAEQALRKAVNLNAYDPQVWSKLIGLYAQTERYDELESVLREAHLALDEEFLPLLNGRYYELQGRWHAAEDIYLSAYRNQLDSPAIAQRLAEFYTNWPASQGGDPMRAAPYINMLLRQANEGQLEQNNPLVAWARRRAARLLATRGDYASAVKAESILEPLVAADDSSVDDVRELAQILSVRLDPAARQRAINLWQRIKQSGQLRTSEALLLGRLMSDSGRRGDAQQMLEDVIAKNSDDMDLIRGYALLLIDQREYSRARRQIDSLERKGAEPGVLAELQLRLAARSGDKEKTRELLQAMTPDLRRMTEQQLATLPQIADLANELGDHEFALRLYSEYARRDPAGQMDFARMAGLYGDPEESIEMLKRLFADNIDESLRVALEIMRARRPEVGDALDSDIERLVRRALSDDPENARRLVLQAEMLEIEEKFDESAAAYEALLQRSDLPTLVRATALNNLAFLLALKGESARLDESLEYVNQAVKLIGPISDILDTRAVVQTARGEYDAAVQDMRQAVQIGPTPSKFFHLAQAEMGAGRQDEALEAWQQGIDEGLSLDSVSLLEHDAFEEFSKQMQSLGGAGPSA
ncbi:MAG: tetratricopeptide repeat protein [Planctomycetales bacterium]|nr:tetratricopeptide repeat protein [Planctomycetales bacterium]